MNIWKTFTVYLFDKIYAREDVVHVCAETKTQAEKNINCQLDK